MYVVSLGINGELIIFGQFKWMLRGNDKSSEVNIKATDSKWNWEWRAEVEKYVENSRKTGNIQEKQQKRKHC